MRNKYSSLLVYTTKMLCLKKEQSRRGALLIRNRSRALFASQKIIVYLDINSMFDVGKDGDQKHDENSECGGIISASPSFTHLEILYFTQLNGSCNLTLSSFEHILMSIKLTRLITRFVSELYLFFNLVSYF